MIAFLLLLTADPLQKGETWSFERTYRYVNEAAGVDLSDVDRTDVLVAETRASGYDLSISRRLLATKIGEAVTPAPDGQAIWKAVLRFGTNGQPLRPAEDLERPIRARIDRMLWTASENRQGLGWSRVWPKNEELPEGKVTIKPGKEGSLAVNYAEGTDLRIEATAKRDEKRPIIAEFAGTINRITLPGGTVPVSVAVKQGLK